jgi:hypothetical protein
MIHNEAAMESRRIFLRAAATVFAAILLAAFFSLSGDEPPPAPRPAEPELFPFLKPMDAVAAETAFAHPAPAIEEEKATGPGRPVHPPLAEAPDKVLAVEREASRMRAQGASEDEIYRMRAGALSAETASRIADMERAEIAWRLRLDAYLSARARLLALDGTANDSTRQALQQLRNTHFSMQEQERLAASEPAGFPVPTLP